MDHEQARHEKHEQDRKQKQAEERQSEQQFSKPGPTIRPLWFLALGFVLVLIALVIWWQAYLP
jgi:cytoskeletal protein RodZ